MKQNSADSFSVCEALDLRFSINLSWNLKTDRKMVESPPLLPATAFCRAVLQLSNCSTEMELQ
jgi:hypothetical protein